MQKRLQKSVFSFLFFPLIALATPQRIVTLSPVISEWTAEILGQELALKSLVGVSEYSHYPASLKAVITVGPYTRVDPEKIAALHPDLVLGSEEYTQPEQIQKLKRLKLNVVILPKENFFRMNDWIRKLSEVLQKKERGESVALRWQTELAQIQKEAKKNKPETFFIQIQERPLVTVGKESFITDAFSVLHLKNIFADLGQAYPKVSQEAVLKRNPQQVFILDLTGKGEGFEESRERWKQFAQLEAVQKNKVKTLSGDDFARCSFRLLGALKDLLR